jgi:hypothetical protein
MRWTPTPTRSWQGDYELALWHGFNLPLLLSVLVLAIGTAAFFGRSAAAHAADVPAAGQRGPQLRRGDPRRRWLSVH